jgi:hypothetical protein
MKSAHKTILAATGPKFDALLAEAVKDGWVCLASYDGPAMTNALLVKYTEEESDSARG